MIKGKLAPWFPPSPRHNTPFAVVCLLVRKFVRGNRRPRPPAYSHFQPRLVGMPQDEPPDDCYFDQASTRSFRFLQYSAQYSA
ncbi:hypothetical protein VTK26DRAFT_652 [Humicola hyalothermophila]